MSYWMPLNHYRKDYRSLPAVGDLIAIDAPGLRYKAWRLSELREHGDGWALTIREPDAPDLAASDKHHLSVPRLPHRSIWVLPERYAVCSCCGDIMPCRHEMEDRTVKAVTDRSVRYEAAGMCPACGEAVTSRQACVTFATNLYAMLGPTVTFHRRQKCLRGAVEYDVALAKHENRPATLSCPGTITRHTWSEWDKCTSTTCPGPGVHHRGYDGYCLHRPCDICQGAVASHTTTTTESETP